MKVSNRTFVVSGGSSGLGLATVEDLLSQGAYVSILDLSSPPTKNPAISNNFNSYLKYFKTDITNLSQIESAIKQTVSWTLETKARLGGVINCAGVGIPAKIIDAHGEPHSLELWNFMLAVNLTGSFNLTRLMLKYLVKVEPEESADGERGVVIFVSSAAAYEGHPGHTAYSATKGALRSMTLPMARELARYAIRVVSIAPGPFDTNLTAPLSGRVRKSLENGLYPSRFGQPNEFARTVRWILDCPYVNGETFRLSGGGRLPAKL